MRIWLLLIFASFLGANPFLIDFDTKDHLTESDWVEVQQKLQATSILEGNRLKWVYMPSYPVNTTDSGLWILNATLRNYKEQTLKENKDNGNLPNDTSCAY